MNADNTVSVMTSQVELGQGIATGFMQVVAEELDLAIDQMRYGSIFENPIKNIVVDTDEAVQLGGVGGSRSMSGQGPSSAPLPSRRGRRCSDSPRQARRPRREPVGLNGIVSGGGKSTTYGELVGGRLLNVKLTTTDLDPA